MKINIGIIGCKRGIKLINILKKINIKFNIVAAYDNDETNLNLIKSQNIKLFRNQENFFKYKNMNAVYIASPVDHHIKHSIEAAKKNLHILCEVPAFRKISDGKKLYRLIKKKKINLYDG